MPKKKAGTIFDMSETAKVSEHAQEPRKVLDKPKEEDAEEVAGEPAGFKELDEHDETPDEIEHKMHAGGAEVDVYTEEGREELMEDDEVSEWEEGFAEGETDPEKAHCAACGKVLSQDESKVVEREINHVTYNFCCDKCAAAGIQHAKKK